MLWIIAELPSPPLVSECRWTESECTVKQWHNYRFLRQTMDSPVYSPYCKQTSSHISDGMGTYLWYTNQGMIRLRILQFGHLAVLCSYQQGWERGQRWFSSATATCILQDKQEQPMVKSRLWGTKNHAKTKTLRFDARALQLRGHYL